MSRQSSLVYGLLLAAWVAIVAWQTVEHSRVKDAARTALVYRARDITTTLGLVVRAQRRFDFVWKERLESALKELVKSDEVKSISLLNVTGEVVAAAGAPVDLETKGVVQSGEHWSTRSVTLVNLVDLGTNVVQEGESPRPIIVMPRPDSTSRTNDDRRGGPRPAWWRGNRGGTNFVSTNRTEFTAEARSESPRDPAGRPPFARPPWMGEDEYKSLIQKQGLHSFVVVMSTQAVQTVLTGDLWLRFVIGALGAVAAGGLAIAWRSVLKFSELQIRLLRASELTSHLKELNIAAAGLAHETRNPLNIIRGLAQMISKQADASPEVQRKSREITEEVDRVTAQLNQFINYSKPREVRRAPVSLDAVVGEVARALQVDLEDKTIRLSLANNDFTIEADEQMLRQLLFNLLLNATQAVAHGGEIRVVSRRIHAAEVSLDVCDDGPGVPTEQCQEIFKPYFTTHQKGTGLGLAVVQQIALAHGWEIQCLPNEPRGAIFRLSHLKLCPTV